MSRFIKKTILALILAVSTISSTGCAMVQDFLGGGEKLNKERGDGYKYDFVQFLSVKLYGSNGNGFLEVTPKEIKVSDFESEQEYIAVKKVLSELNLVLDPTNSKSSKFFTATPSKGLSNGDIVTFGFNESYTGNAGGLSFNLEPYEFQIQGLPDPVQLDLFSPDTVTFVGLDDGTTNLYPIKKYGNEVSDEILDNLEYLVTTDESSLQAEKTIINCSVDVLPQKDENGRPTNESLEVYLGKKGYVVASEKAEKVLMEIAKPLTFSTEKTSKINRVLFKTFKAIDETLINIGTVQQLSVTQSGYSPYDYIVTYYADAPEDSESTDPIVKRAAVKMAESDTAGIAVLSVTSNPSRTDSSYGYSAYNGMTLMAVYGGAPEPEPTVEPTPAPTETPEATPEAGSESGQEDSTDQAADASTETPEPGSLSLPSGVMDVLAP